MEEEERGVEGDKEESRRSRRRRRRRWKWRNKIRRINGRRERDNF